MPPIVTSDEIERPAAEVFAYATDPSPQMPRTEIRPASAAQPR